VAADPLREALEKRYHPGHVRKLVSAKRNEYGLTQHEALLAVARDLKMNWTRFASPEELASLRNLDTGRPVVAPPAVPSAPTASARPTRGRATKESASRKTGPRDKVFVVRGRNAQIRNAMFAFLRALELKPVEWGQAMKATGTPMPFIAKTLESALSGPNAVVVLMTPDEIVQLKRQFVSKIDPDEERKPMGQPRPNVFFEAGMALARHPEKTIFVIFGRVKSFSDIAGMHTVRMNNTAKKRTQLVDKLRTAGADPQTEGKEDWTEEGDFDLKEEDDGENQAP
jgi:predicted nucleotide-binding protein